MVRDVTEDAMRIQGLHHGAFRCRVSDLRIALYVDRATLDAMLERSRSDPARNHARARLDRWTTRRAAQAR
jgi:hypothetical protein